MMELPCWLVGLLVALAFVAPVAWGHGAFRYRAGIHRGICDPAESCRYLMRRGYDMRWKLQELERRR